MDKEAYNSAKEALKNRDYETAERHFKAAFDSTHKHVGLANDGQYNNANEHGILLCREAASNELLNGDVFLNLACAELASDNRKRAIEAIQLGMERDPHHARLKHACSRIGCRKQCCFGFLARNHFLNRFFGRLMRRDKQELTADSLLY